MRTPLFSLRFGAALLAFIAAAATLRANNVAWQSIDLPTTGVGGTEISFEATVTNTGTNQWGGNYYRARLLGLPAAGDAYLTSWSATQNQIHISRLGAGGEAVPSTTLTVLLPAGK